MEPPPLPCKPAWGKHRRRKHRRRKSRQRKTRARASPGACGPGVSGVPRLLRRLAPRLLPLLKAASLWSAILESSVGSPEGETGPGHAGEDTRSPRSQRTRAWRAPSRPYPATLLSIGTGKSREADGALKE